MILSTSVPKTELVPSDNTFPMQKDSADRYFHVKREVDRYIQWHEFLKEKHYSQHPFLQTLFNKLAQYSLPNSFNLTKLIEVLELLEPYKPFIVSAYKAEICITIKDHE